MLPIISLWIHAAIFLPCSALQGGLWCSLSLSLSPLSLSLPLPVSLFPARPDRKGDASAAVQVALTDDVPLYVLGGTIMTLGGGGMTTDAAKNSSLTFIVAMPSKTSPTPSLCGKGCPSSSNGSMVACGHMYLDGGEELDVGDGLDNYISLTAEVTPVRAPTATLRRHW